MRTSSSFLRLLTIACSLFLLPTLTLTPLHAQSSEEVCRIGLYYKVLGEGDSKSLPVLTAVQPFGPAAIGGFLPGDLITQIDGVPTEGLTYQQVSELLTQPVREHLLTIVRVGSGATAHLLVPSCKATYALTERELAIAFAGYSPLDQAKQERTLPLTISGSRPFDWSQAKTFAFAPASEEDKALYETLYGQIATLLEKRGVRQEANTPNLVFQCVRSQANDAPALTLQVTASSQSSEPLWTSTTSLPAGKEEIRSYSQQIIPVMLQGFPFATTSTPSTYTEEIHRYLYTGILYDSRDLSRIADVEEDSPAFTAGLRVGDKILRIDGKPMSSTSVADLSARYRDFLDDTYRYRTAEAMRPEQAPWKSSSYTSVRKALVKDKYANVFSYLFAFRPYISEGKQTELSIDIERNGETYTLSLTPILRDESVYIPH